MRTRGFLAKENQAFVVGVEIGLPGGVKKGC
jgi:hypothetical protein